MPDPVKLEYSTPTPKPKTPVSKRVIGLLGFLLYALPAFVFDAYFILIMYRFPNIPVAMVAVVGLIGGFCTWRAIAGLLQLFR